MKCQNCNQDITSKFCPYCGTNNENPQDQPVESSEGSTATNENNTIVNESTTDTFGQESTTQEQPVDPFGQPINAEQQATDPFGQPINAGQQAADPFGQPVNAEQQATDPFGQPINAGQQAADPFGQATSSQQESNPFGQDAPQAVPYSGNSYQNTSSSYTAEKPWYAKTFVIVLFLLFIWPVGVILMWKQADWAKGAKIAVSIIIGLLLAISIGSCVCTSMLIGNEDFQEDFEDEYTSTYDDSTYEDDSSTDTEGSSLVVSDKKFQTENIIIDYTSAEYYTNDDGENILVVKYNFTNLAEEPQSASWIVKAYAYQNGVEIDTAYEYDQLLYQNSSDNIQQGVTVEAASYFILTDTTNPVTVQLSEYFYYDSDEVLEIEIALE